ncbi:MAG: hypothetical protein HWN51_07325 [Desulfobacterales bacterium]|nr:hypothetical protein [Desulfobacterales bacterium]
MCEEKIDGKDEVIGKCGKCGELIMFVVDDEENAAEEINGRTCPGCGWVIEGAHEMTEEEQKELTVLANKELEEAGLPKMWGENGKAL